MGMQGATGVKVFSTTLARDRDALGEVITRWIHEHPELEIVDKAVRQSSDRQFHCLSVTLFYREGKGV
jgi:folate-dependent tRNA-U54 methylase TrmFO/GidA